MLDGSSPSHRVLEILERIKTMRDPNRLQNLYKRIAKAHKECYPDFRISQLFLNLFSMSKTDLYSMEDEEFVSLVEKFLGQFKR